jgi:WD40 repeat-containing protein SMU1
MAVEVESADVIRLIIQFLKENGLTTSLRALQEETQVSLNTVDNMETFTADILNGRWEAVLTSLSSLRLSANALMSVFEQMVIEMAELRELDTARALMRTAPALLTMKAEYPQRFHKLEQISQRTYFDPNDAYSGSTRDNQRQFVADTLAREIQVAAPSRLLSLINQALKWQQHTGMLPSGKGAKYDLFKGKAQSDAIEAEHFPTKLSQKIKFGKKSHCECCVFSPDGQYLVSGSSDGFVEVYDYETGKLTKELKYQAEDDIMMHESPVSCIAFSRDGELLSSGDSSGTVKVWRLSTGSCVRKFLNIHTAGLSSIEFARDGTQLLTSSKDMTVRIHGLKSGRTLKEMRGHTSYVNTAIYGVDHDQVISGSADGTIKVWNAKTTECLRTFKPDPDSAAAQAVSGLACLPRQVDKMLVCSRSSSLRVLNTSGQTLLSFSSAQGDFACSALSTKGKFVFGVSDDQVLYTFSAESGKVEHVLKLHEKAVLGFATHPFRNVFASWSEDGSIKIWKS